MTISRPLFGRRFALALVLALGFSTVAKAIAPFVLVPPAIEVLGGVMTMKNFLAASMGAHAAVALIWGNKDGSSNPATTATGGQITVYIDPKKPLAAPSGWTEASPGTSNTGSNPQPTNTAPAPSPQVMWTGHLVSNGAPLSKASASEFADVWSKDHAAVQKTLFVAVIKAEPAPWDPAQLLVRYSFKTGTDPTTYEAGDYAPGSKSSTCPSGYSISADGKSCTLTDPAAVKKPADSNCAIVRTGNTFGTDPQDPDCSTMAATMPTPSTIQLKKNNETLEATINADGSVTTKMTGPDASGNTETTIINFAPPTGSMGVPATGTSNTTTQGTGDLNNPGVQVPKLELPTDYNREATQQAIKADTAAIKDALKANGEDLSAAKAAEQAQKTAIENGLKSDAGGWFESLKAKWYSFNPPIESAACTPLTQSFKGTSFTWDFCPAVNVIRALLGFLAYFGTLAALWHIGLGTRHA